MSATVCASVCVQVGGPSSLNLALRLKRCQQVCDETSQTIPHLGLFHSGSSCLTVSSSVPYIMQPPLSLSCPHFFFSLSICPTDTHSFWSLLLFFSLPFISYQLTHYVYSLSSSLLSYHFSLNHFVPPPTLFSVQ